MENQSKFSPSQRLRHEIWKLWEAIKPSVTSEEYYEAEMERIILSVQQKRLSHQSPAPRPEHPHQSPNNIQV